MTYPPQPGGHDPYGQQQPGYGQQPGYSPQQPVTGVPSSPAGGYGQPAYPQQQPGYGPPAGGPVPEPGERPGMVTTAAMLMVAMTVLSLILGGIIVFAGIESSNDALELCSSDYASADCEDEAAGLKIGSIIGGVIYLIVGIGVIGLALAVLRGHNWARITTWSVYGLFGLCGICGLLMSFGALSSMSSMAGSGEMGGGIIVVLGLLLQLVVEGLTVGLLAAPAANQWFREVGAAKRAGVI